MIRIACMSAIVGVVASAAVAHDGRRFEIEVRDGKLVAQGYVSGGNPDDGGGLVRPYINAIHGHWEYNPAPGVVAASADLPGFDVILPGGLVGHDVILTLVGGFKWSSPPMMPPAGTVPAWEALGAGEEIYITHGIDTVSTSSPGTFVLASNISAGGAPDLDLSYDIAAEPTDVLMVLEFVLSTDAPGVLSSDIVYVVLSPPGELHHASLYSEAALGSVAPDGCDGDANGDGVTDVNDITYVLFRLGTCD